jgi:hypothetical protein
MVCWGPAFFGLISFFLSFFFLRDIASVIKSLQTATSHRDPMAKTGAALKFANRQLFSRSQRFNKVLVVITDGRCLVMFIYDLYTSSCFLEILINLPPCLALNF